MGAVSATEGQGQEQSAGDRRRRPPLVVIAAVVLVVAAAFVWFGFLRPSGSKAATKSGQHVAVAAEAPTVVDTPELIVNLDAGPHRISFAKVQLGIEAERATDAAALKAAMPRVVDMTETYLRSVRPEELRSDTGAYLLREALLSRMAVVVPRAQVDQILFEELLVQ